MGHCWEGSCLALLLPPTWSSWCPQHAYRPRMPLCDLFRAGCCRLERPPSGTALKHVLGVKCTRNLLVLCKALKYVLKSLRNQWGLYFSFKIQQEGTCCAAPGDLSLGLGVRDLTFLQAACVRLGAFAFIIHGHEKGLKRHLFWGDSKHARSFRWLAGLF